MPRKAASTPKPVEIDRPRTPLVLAGVLVLGIALTAGAIAWGRSDSGEINVAATINNSNLEGGEGEGGAVQQAPAPEHASLPNGGLVAAGESSNPAPAPVPEETGSTTEEGDVSGEESETADDVTEDAEADEATVAEETPAEAQ